MVKLSVKVYLTSIEVDLSVHETPLCTSQRSNSFFRFSAARNILTVVDFLSVLSVASKEKYVDFT